MLYDPRAGGVSEFAMAHRLKPQGNDEKPKSAKMEKAIVVSLRDDEGMTVGIMTDSAAGDVTRASERWVEASFRWFRAIGSVFGLFLMTALVAVSYDPVAYAHWFFRGESESERFCRTLGGLRASGMPIQAHPLWRHFVAPRVD